MHSFVVHIASEKHHIYADQICTWYNESARERGTGIAKRNPAYIRNKMSEHKAIIALAPDEQLVGFCYIESWGNKQYVANSGLIINPELRGGGIAKKIKKTAFFHSKKMFPEAKLFGLTTSLPVMKINSDLGYRPVTYNQLTTDEEFWRGCESCVNYEILTKKGRSNCMCTAMLFDPQWEKDKKWRFIKKSKWYEHLIRLKRTKQKTSA